MQFSALGNFEDWNNNLDLLEHLFFPDKGQERALQGPFWTPDAKELCKSNQEITIIQVIRHLKNQCLHQRICSICEIYTYGQNRRFYSLTADAVK